MPIQFTVQEAHNYFIATWQGVLGEVELLRSYDEFWQSESFKPGMNELCNTLEADLEQISPGILANLQHAAERMLAQHNQAMKTAVVLSGALSQGLARVYDAWAIESPEEIKLFNELDAAKAWLASV